MNWGQRTNSALASINAYKRQINNDLNTRARMVRDAQRCAPNVAPHIEQLIRAPLAGLR